MIFLPISLSHQIRSIAHKYATSDFEIFQSLRRSKLSQWKSPIAMLCIDLLIIPILISASINDRRLHFSFRHTRRTLKNSFSWSKNKVRSNFRMMKKEIAKHDAFLSSRPTHEKKMERSFGHIINSSRKKKERMMIDLIAGSFDILVRRVCEKKRSHRRRWTQKAITDSKIPFSCKFLLSSVQNVPAL